MKLVKITLHVDSETHYHGDNEDKNYHGIQE